MAEKPDLDLDQWRSRLESERARRVEELESPTYDMTNSADQLDMMERGYSNHLGEDAQITYNKESDLTFRQMLESEIQQIERALQRIENGTYGICAATGNPIETERLEVLPWTEYSIEGQRKIEAQNNRGR